MNQPAESRRYPASKGDELLALCLVPSVYQRSVWLPSLSFLSLSLSLSSMPVFTHDTFDNDMPNQPWSAKCSCGKRFRKPNSYALHIGCCLVFKKRLGRNLREARERHRTANTQSNPAEASGSASDGRESCSTGKKRVRPSWLADNSEDLGVDIVKQHVVAAPVTLEDAQPDDTVDEDPEDLGRGLRVKKMAYRIRRAANVRPSCPSALPASLYDSLLKEEAERRAASRKKPREPPPVDPPNREDPPSHEPKLIQTRTNRFGLYKSYKLYSDDAPYDPDASTSPSDLQECPEDSLISSPEEPDIPDKLDSTIDPSDPESEDKTDEQNEPSEPGRLKKPYKKPDPPPYAPFPNISSFRLGEWFWSDDHEKSQRSFRNLLDIVGSESFKPADVRSTNWTQINETLASSFYEDDGSGSGLDDDASWRTVPTTIDVPISKSSERPGSYRFTVPDFHYRPLVPIIKEKLQSATQQENFHTLGCELRWKPGECKQDVRVYGELYNSPVFIQAYEDLQNMPPEPDCNRPRHIVGLMFASDATMLASFGSAKVWPCYMFFGNDSKYKRSKPSEKLFETVAYFEKLPDQFKDFVAQYTGKSALNPTLLTHCQRELFHEQWKHILDAEFLEAYCHGIVVTCYDGIERRFYPRIFTYSADYPEKILIASIKNLGTFPCPRCKVAMKDVPAMGKFRDRNTRVRWARVDDENRRKRVVDARNYLYKDHLSLASTYVEARMDDGSLVPTDNAFSARLSSQGFNLFRMLVVDVMHEVELGVWKALFIQLLRLLEATEKGRMNELDARYRSMPTFGRDTIRRFINNVSEMKQLAARDFEDLLQCAIPAFEGLLPSPHNKRVVQLLFTFGRWHGFAKLRLHTDHTLEILDQLTSQLGEEMRSFVEKTCTKFETKELTREYQARKRREAQKEKGTAASHMAVLNQLAGSQVDGASRSSSQIPERAGQAESEKPVEQEPQQPKATVEAPSNPRRKQALGSGTRKDGDASNPAAGSQGENLIGSTEVSVAGNKRKGECALKTRAAKRAKVAEETSTEGTPISPSRGATAIGKRQTRTGRGAGKPVQPSEAPSNDPSPNELEAPEGSKSGGKRRRKASAGSLGEASKRPRASQEQPGGQEQPEDQGPALTTGTEIDEKGEGRKAKTLNLKTYKWHALGDVVSTIRLFGTTDSYSTQMPERFHRYPKMHFKRTNKRNVPRQLSRIQARQSRIRKLRKQLLPDISEKYRGSEEQAASYFIGKSENHPIELPAFIQTKRYDPAIKSFIPKLKSHLLPRVYRRLLEEEEASEDRDEGRLQLLKSLALDPSCADHQQHEPDSPNHNTPSPASPSDVDRLYLHSDRIYQHNILNVNYTSYDVRRETDIVNPRTSRRDIMCLRVVDDSEVQEGDPSCIPRFMHARVLGVYHVNVVYRGRGASDLRKRRFDVLLIRWYSFCEGSPSPNSFDRLSLRPVTDSDAIAFLDPGDVLRASHIIPRYSLGQVYGPSDEGRIQSKIANDQDDWREYYVNSFVDRDMIMRYTWGHGVGHTYSHGDAPDMPPSESSAVPDPTQENLDEEPTHDAAEEERNIDGSHQAEATEDTLENLEEQELAVADPEGQDQESDFEDRDVQEPDTEVEDVCVIPLIPSTHIVHLFRDHHRPHLPPFEASHTGGRSWVAGGIPSCPVDTSKGMDALEIHRIFALPTAYSRFTLSDLGMTSNAVAPGNRDAATASSVPIAERHFTPRYDKMQMSALRVLLGTTVPPRRPTTSSPSASHQLYPLYLLLLLPTSSAPNEALGSLTIPDPLPLPHHKCIVLWASLSSDILTFWYISAWHLVAHLVPQSAKGSAPGSIEPGQRLPTSVQAEHIMHSPPHNLLSFIV
ncbi:hypothetical protein NMY22_g8529 [Coprinellus aureogranulatus]|nr:hypothetical protein NMY22_g8529 [Coprinellus aureogranulatus]